MGRFALLERHDVLDRLRQHASQAAAGAGRMVLVTGEAGIGKSTALRLLLDDLPAPAQVWAGACERLFAARPLGPFADMIEVLPEELGNAVRRGAPVHELLPMVLEEVRATPTVIAIEDIHWADEASLDLIALLGRRIAGTHGLVLVTCRDDELAADYPARVVLGSMVSAGVERIGLSRLSLDAVRQLASGTSIDVEDLHRMTGGNPFFLTEVLAAGGERLPRSVRDAVLARAAALTPAARTLLAALSVVPGSVPTELVSELGGSSADQLGPCLMLGMLIETSAGVAFRHDLARVSVEAEVDPLRRIALHRIALRVLRESGADAARLAHHADGAHDAEALEELGSRAAFEAVAGGAHREAVAQCERALRPRRHILGRRRAELLELGAHQLYLTDRFEEGISWLQDAIAIRRAAGDRVGEADAWRQLSAVGRCGGRNDDALRSGRRAVTLLVDLPPTRELAAAYANLAMLALNSDRIEDGLAAAEQALPLVDEIADLDLLVYLLNTRGFLRVLAGDQAGIDDLERSLALSLATGLDEHVGRAYVHLADLAQRHRRWAIIDDRAVQAETYCLEHGLDLWTRYLRMYLARTKLDRGRWDEALATLPPDDLHGTPLARKGPLVITGLIAARRGQSDPWPDLDEAFELAERSGELQWLAPATTARLEAAWLSGERQWLAAAAGPVLEACIAAGAGWWAGEITWWRRCLGYEDATPAIAAEPWKLMLQGRFDEAAEAWRVLGCPYEEAMALSADTRPVRLRQAFERFDILGAKPAAAVTARRMRSLGVATVPRGSRASTRHNPAGLTSREVEVLRLLVQGMQNREIAVDLVLSPKTVDHHLAAVYRKLGVSDRRAAARSAVALGIE